ncbi:peptidase M23 [Streptomyces pseudoechinosporeus]
MKTRTARIKGTLGRKAAVMAGIAAAGALALTGPQALAADTGRASAQAKEVYVWATNVRLHVEPYVNSPSPAKVSQETLIGFCQKQGDTVTEPGQGTSSWWTLVEKPGGSDSLFISNVYLVGGEKIEGIPDC